MRERDQSMLDDLLKPEDRAVEAVVARYQRVAPAITRFARTLSGNEELRVRLGSDPAASVSEIVCDPRVFQAAYNRNAPVTPDEVALASALHEVVHLVATNLDEHRTVPEDWPRISKEATIPEGEVDLLAALDSAGGPVTETFFFALEDARQERHGLTAYPGARSVLTDLYRAAFSGAVGRTGALSQFLLGCFLLVGEYLDRSVLERRFDARAAVALDDATDILDEVRASNDVWEVGGFALRLEAIARAHGLLTEVPDAASQTQRRLAERSDADKAADGVDEVRLSSPILQDADSYQDIRRAAEARAERSDKKGASDVADDEATDQLLRVSQAPRVFLPDGQAGPLVVTPIPAAFRRFGSEGRGSLTETAARWGVAQRHVSGELFPLFAANQRRGLRSGYDQGDVSPHAALFIGAGLYQRLYERRSARTRRTYAVSLLVDASASMLMSRPHGPRRRGAPTSKPWGMSAALLGAWTLARLADELQIDFEVALFNRGFAARPDDTEWSYTRGRSAATAGLRRTQGASADRLTATPNHYLVKPFDRRWRESEDVLAGLFWTAASPREAAAAARREPGEAPPVSMFEKAANVDEFNVIHAAERMARLGAQVRVLIVLADGMTRGSVEALRSSVAAVEASGTTVLGIGIGDDTVDNAYKRSQVVEQPEQLTTAMVDGTRAALRRSLAIHGMDTWWLRSSTEPRKEAS